MKSARTTEIGLVDLKKAYYDSLDRKADALAECLTLQKAVTVLILDCIRELYRAAKTERRADDANFESAYHQAVSSDVEFLVARILYHYSERMHLGWKLLLRRQVSKTAPDVRIELASKTLAVIEVKAKAGWIQTIFSRRRYDKDMEKYVHDGTHDPQIAVKRFADQCQKYCSTFGIDHSRVFILLPSLVLVHRKHSSDTIDDYQRFFSENSGLSVDSLILLSTNLSLDLSHDVGRIEYAPTRRFEDLVEKLRPLGNSPARHRTTGNQVVHCREVPL